MYSYFTISLSLLFITLFILPYVSPSLSFSLYIPPSSAPPPLLRRGALAAPPSPCAGEVEQEAVRERLHRPCARPHDEPQGRAERARRGLAVPVLALSKADQDALSDHAPGAGE